MKMITIIVLLFFVYLLFFTPYPFVLYLRSKKNTVRSKSPADIADIYMKIKKEPGLTYISKFRNNTYDSYTPIEKNEDTLIIWLHGGAFVSGNSRGMRNFGPMLASKEFNVCAMNYEHAPEKPFPTQVIQIDEMISYARNYMGDYKNIVLGGDSAGANLVACYATLYRNQKAKDELGIKLQTEKNIDALLLFCGPYDFTESYKDPRYKEFHRFMKYIGWSYFGKARWQQSKETIYASPLHNINDEFPPTYITDGKKYSFLWQGKKLVEELNKQGIKVKSRFFENMVHEFQFDYERYPEEAMQVYNDVLSFLNEILRR